VVRSIRLDLNLDDSLQKIAASDRINFNQLANSLFTEFAEWGNRAKKFGCINIPRELILALIEDLDDEQIEKIARRLGPHVVREMLQFWFKSVAPDSFKDYVRLVSRYSGTAQYEIEESDSINIMTIHHYFGRKWSVLIGNMYDEAIKTLFGLSTNLDISARQVILHWAS
jgi:hypothetical protein